MRGSRSDAESDANFAAVFLSPHFDDVALSCGGTVASVAASGEQGRAQIVTVFGDVPPDGTVVTPYAQSLLAEWGAPLLAEAVRLRHAEDEAAARVLGASLVTLPFADGAFRGDTYPNWPALQTTLAPADADLPAQIAEAVRATGLLTRETTLIGPLGAGRHVDHQAVFAALMLLAPDVAAIWLYEDFPYAARNTDAVQSSLAAIGLTNSVPHTHDISGWLQTKIRAIACYTSQVPILFPETSMPDAVHAYAEVVAGEAGAAERFWPLHSHSREKHLGLMRAQIDLPPNPFREKGERAYCT